MVSLFIFFILLTVCHGYLLPVTAVNRLNVRSTAESFLSSKSSSFEADGSNTSVEDLIEEDDEEELVFEENAPKVTWTACVKSSAKVKEINRSVEEYMGLPASEYSVLSAEQIERLR